MYMYGAYMYSVPAEGEVPSSGPPGYVAWVGRSCGDGGGGGGSCCTAMRGVQLGIVYWLLCAIYLFAALGSVVASGDSGAAAVQLSFRDCSHHGK